MNTFKYYTQRYNFAYLRYSSSRHCDVPKSTPHSSTSSRLGLLVLALCIRNLYLVLFMCYSLISPKVFGHEIFLKFFHAKHLGFFEKHSFECTDCHAGHLTTFKVTNQALCHQCHVSDKYTKDVPQNCTLCHSNLKSIRPKDHTNKWIQGAHREIAKTSKKLCIECHRVNFCIDCHKKRDDIRKRVHTRNFLFTHSIEMRRKPSSCNSCHTQNYCISCHRTRGVRE
jgi:hypothetical protein